MKAFLVGLLLFLISYGAVQAHPFCPTTPVQCQTSRLARSPDGQVLIHDVCDLQNIPANATGSYVLAENIDATCTAKWNGGNGFTPIASFGGQFSGQGHWINGLRIVSSASSIGLFQSVTQTGSVDHVALVNANVNGTGNGQDIGALVGTNYGHITQVFVSGCVGGLLSCLRNSTDSLTVEHIGGAVGRNFCKVSLSASGATIIAGPGGGNNGQYTYGGLVGYNAKTVTQSSSFGLVSDGGAGCCGNGGGLVGFSYAIVTQSDSSATVSGAEIILGGLVGWDAGGRIQQSYASGTVVSSVSDDGGLSELVDQFAPVDQAYAVGAVTSPTYVGGLIARVGFEGVNLTNSYWDTDTSGTAVSAAGAGMDTGTFKAVLPSGFDPSVWNQVAGISYPFYTGYNCSWKGASASDCALTPFAIKGFPLTDPACNDPDGNKFFCLTLPPRQSFFEAPLAQFAASSAGFAVNAGMHTIQPLGQLQLFQYTKYTNAEVGVQDDSGKTYAVARLAGEGTVYTMLAHLVGELYPGAQIVPDSGTQNMCHRSESAAQAHIDCLLQDSTDPQVRGRAMWPGSLGQYASIGAPAALDDAAVENLVAAGSLLILRGAGVQPGHAMLVTSLVKDGAGNVTRLVANDPELGMQLYIDMNPADRFAYHRALLHATGTGDRLEYRDVAGFNFIADSFSVVSWQTPRHR